MRISRTSWNFQSGKLSNIKWGKNLARFLVTLELLFFDREVTPMLPGKLRLSKSHRIKVIHHLPFFIEWAAPKAREFCDFCEHGFEVEGGMHLVQLKEGPRMFVCARWLAR